MLFKPAQKPSGVDFWDGFPRLLVPEEPSWSAETADWDGLARTMKVDVSGTYALRRDLRRTREAPKLLHRFIFFDDEEEELAWVQKHYPK